mmetsp:Transcript_23551/g.84045  ORF Transcript_23551/g.84045 Transcript_23551/m.84045 type:complete len:284 (+) Transcript_23551:59-910(+)
MPLDCADFGATDALRPASLEWAMRVGRYNPPGPGSYDLGAVQTKSTKFKSAPKSSFGQSKATRFAEYGTAVPGPGLYKTQSAVGTQVSSMVDTAPRSVMGMARTGTSPPPRTPGPSDYRVGASSHFPTPPKPSFGGPLAKRDRFADVLRDVANPRSPGPGGLLLPSTLSPDKASGAPKVGLAQRFMPMPKRSQDLPLGETTKSAGSLASDVSQSFYFLEHLRPGPGAQSRNHGYISGRMRVCRGTSQGRAPPPRGSAPGWRARRGPGLWRARRKRRRVGRGFS